MSLYQSYRPKNFSDVVGQNFIKKVLSNSCISQTFHHGYIFFGFHGIGKTTLARIFAEAVNCTNITPDGNPCHTCPNCISYDTGKMIDVIEIDAASYTGVDNIREVIDHARFTPTQGRYKVYIVDEVHMLSKGAFNALLKTLEEPPAHVIFLLATTEIHKVPDTILSRVIRFDLTKIGTKDMYDYLASICEKQGITYEKEALECIVHRARGSMRDALTILEKCLIANTLSTTNVRDALQLVDTNFLIRTFEAMKNGNAQDITDIIETLEKEAVDVRQFSSQMTEWIVEHIAEAFEKNTFTTSREIFDLFTNVYAQSRQVSVPMDLLKMALYQRITSGKLVQTKEQVQGLNDIKGGKEIEEKVEKDEQSEEQEQVQEQGLVKNNFYESNPPVKGDAGKAGGLKNTEQKEQITEQVQEQEWNDNKTETEANSPLSDQREEEGKGGVQKNEITEQITINDQPSTINENKDFSKDGYILKIQELGIKSTLLPLLKTANITKNEHAITIETTNFCKNKCSEMTTISILENAAKIFGVSNIIIQALVIEGLKEPPLTDIARSIFDS